MSKNIYSGDISFAVAFDATIGFVNETLGSSFSLRFDPIIFFDFELTFSWFFDLKPCLGFDSKWTIIYGNQDPLNFL